MVDVRNCRWNRRRSPSRTNVEACSIRFGFGSIINNIHKRMKMGNNIDIQDVALQSCSNNAPIMRRFPCSFARGLRLHVVISAQKSTTSSVAIKGLEKSYYPKP